MPALVARLFAAGLASRGFSALTLRVVAGVLAALALTFGSGRALAAEAVPPEAAGASEAPMCDPMAASVVARPEIPLARGGQIETLPCDEASLGAFELWLAAAAAKGVALSADERDPGQPSPSPWARERLEGAPLPLPVLLFEGALTRTLSAGRGGLAPSRGHEHLPYRPPLGSARGSA